MLAEIDKDARDIAVLQHHIAKLQHEVIVHLRYIVALEDENRTLKTQQRRDFTRLLQTTDVQYTKMKEMEESVRQLVESHAAMKKEMEINTSSTKLLEISIKKLKAFHGIPLL